MNKANLLKLASYLESLPEGYESFHMGTYMGTKETDVNGNRVREYDLNEQATPNCGTVACALGHGPAAGLPTHRWDDGIWSNYCDRVFGISMFKPKADWCFGPDWQNVDNTPQGAAKRIRYLVEHGNPPEDAEQQMYGEAMLSY